jgi:hypothetical protein
VAESNIDSQPMPQTQLRFNGGSFLIPMLRIRPPLGSFSAAC